MTPRRMFGRHRAQGARALAQVILAAAGLLSCAPRAHYTPPATLAGYDILVTRDDSLGRGIVEGLGRRGFTVRTHVLGGSRPTAYLFAFVFRESEPPALRWLHVRAADTRTGAVVAWVSVPLDSLGPTPAAWARAIVDSLLAQASLKHPGTPP